MKIPKWKILSVIIIVGLCGGFIGYSIGFISALNWGVSKAIWFLDLKGIKIDMNSAMIARGLYQYQNTINGCLFTNASLLNDTGQ